MGVSVDGRGGGRDGRGADRAGRRDGARHRQMRAWSRENRAAGRTVALVPTMGFLHDGHLSLVLAAADQADVVVVSVYVNESQFAEGEDLDIYPRDMQGDLEKLSGLADVVFCPAALYPHGVAAHQSYVQVCVCVYFTPVRLLPPRVGAHQRRCTPAAAQVDTRGRRDYLSTTIPELPPSCCTDRHTQ